MCLKLDSVFSSMDVSDSIFQTNRIKYLLAGFPLTHGVNFTLVSSRLLALTCNSGFNTLLTTFAAMLEKLT